MADNGRKVNIIVDLVASPSSKTEGDKVKTVIGDIGKESEKVTKKRVSDEQAAQREIDKINEQTTKSAQKFINDQEKLDDKLTAQRIANANKAARASADAFLNSLNEVQTKQSGSSGGSSLGSLLGEGGLAEFAAAAAPIAAVGYAIKEVGSYAISTGEELFNLAKNASDYGRELASAQNRTGLTTESLSALRYAANLSGQEFTSLQKPINHFAELMGEAAKGSLDAQQKLKALNVTDFNNLDKALKQSLTYINSLPGGYQKITAEQEAFGGRGVEVMDKVAAKYGLASSEAKKLGLVLSQDQVNAARDFGVAYDRISAQVEGLSAQFALEFAPAITDVGNDLSHFASDNQGAIKQWGVTTGNIIRGAVTSYKELSDFIDQHPYLVAALGFGAVSAASEARKQPQSLGGKAFDTAAKFLIPAYGLASGLSDIGELAPHGIGASAGASNIEKDYTAQFEKQTQELQSAYQTQRSLEAESYKLSEAMLNNHLNFTLQDQIHSLYQQNTLKNNQAQSSLKTDLDYYNKQIELNKGNKEKVNEYQNEITKATIAGNLQRQTNDVNTQHQIAELNQQILNQIRQDTITFYGLQIQSDQQFYDKKIADLQRNISLSGSVQTQDYNQLIYLTEQSYEQVINVTRQKLNEQLQDEKLTKEQKVNLKIQESLEEQKLAEDTRKKIVEIGDKQYAALIAQAQRYRQQTSDLYKSLAGLSSSTANFFTPDNFSSSRAIENAINAPVNNLGRSISEKQAARDNILHSIPDANQDKSKGRLFDELREAGTDNLPNADKLRDIYSQLNVELESMNQHFNLLQDSIIPANTAKFVEFAKQVENGNVKAFDDAAKAALKYQQQLQREDLQSAIRNEQDLIQQARTAHNQNDLNEHQLNLKKLIRQEDQLSQTQALESIELYKKSLTGLEDTYNKLKSGDKATLTALNYNLDQNSWKEKTSLLTQIKTLETGYYKDTTTLALQRALKIEEANKSIYESEVKLSQAMQISNIEINASIKEHLASQQNLSQSIASGFNSTFDAIITKANAGLDKLNEKSHGLLSFITEPLKAIQDNKIGSIYGNIIDKIFPPEIASAFKKTGNPTLDAINKSNDFLKQIAINTSPSNLPASGLSAILGHSASSHSGLSAILSSAIASINGGGGGSSGFNGYTTSSDDIIPTLAAIGLGANNGRGTVDGGILQPNAANNTSLWQGLKNVFSTNQGGIFAPLQGANGQTSALGGYISGAGGIAALLGSLIGGTAGRYLTNIGGGAATGAQIGTLFAPGIGTAIGAAVGAGVGLIESIFGGSTRRQDEQARDALMTTSLNSLNQIKQQLTDYRDGKIQSLNISDLDSQAHAIQTAYFTQANTLHDSKTKNIAVKDGNERVSPLVSIIDALAQGDTLLQSIKESAADRAQRLLPEFASGAYISSAFQSQYNEFKRYNGMMSGSYTGKDYIHALIGDGEMVLNGNQISTVRKRAGFDVFDGVVPNYTPQIQPRFASGVSLNNSSFAPINNNQEITFIFNFEHSVDADGMVTTTLKNSSTARKEVKVIINDGFYNNEINTKRR